MTSPNDESEPAAPIFGPIDRPQRRAGAVVSRVLGLSALAGASVALVMCFVVPLTAPDGGGVDFSLFSYLLAVAVLVPVGVLALQRSQHSS